MWLGTHETNNKIGGKEIDEGEKGECGVEKRGQERIGR